MKTYAVRVVYAHNGGFFAKVFTLNKPASVVEELVRDENCTDSEILAIKAIGHVVYVGLPV